MVSTLKRQLNDEEKKEILNRFGRRCFANGHAIAETDQIQYDHIHAHALGGDSDLNNIAPMCSQHNREKGQLPLDDFRIKLQLDAFFTPAAKLTLRDLLAFLLREKRIEAFGRTVVITVTNKMVNIESSSGAFTHSCYTCPTTGWDYFYATLPISVLDSDDDTDDKVGLQPRYLIKEKVFSLFRHFQRHPVLQPSIGRVTESRIRLFDGQHKIAALLLNNREEFECKVYLNPLQLATLERGKRRRY